MSAVLLQSLSAVNDLLESSSSQSQSQSQLTDSQIDEVDQAIGKLSCFKFLTW